jgi:hypothetical protein
MDKLTRLNHIPVFPIKKNAIYKSDKDLCLVYSLWSHKAYVNICFYSILSQLVFTDIQDYNIMVYVDESIHNYTCKVLNRIIPNSNIIKIKGEECAKQRVAIRQELLDYKVIVMSDADNILQSNNKISIYKKLVGEHLDWPHINFLHRYEDGLNTLAERQHLSEFKDLKNYNEFFKDLIQNLEKNNSWYLTGFISYNKDYISLLKVEVDKCVQHKIFCDETVWRMCTINNTIQKEVFNQRHDYLFVTPENINLIKNKKDNVMYLIHAFLGEYVDKLQLDLIYYTKEKYINWENQI